ncbi:MAG: hypothetical protein N839_0014040 [Desulfofustis sp. PB-SRB1]|jgi:hypothetical protein|nr:hypothetical protein [Desulfofustis sp. PB-SRB1]
MKHHKKAALSLMTRRQLLITSRAAEAAMVLPGSLFAIPVTIVDSEGYLLVDLRKWQG